MADIVRQIAHKVWISDLVNNEFVKQSGEWEPNYVTIKNLKVSRVNIIANIVTKYKSDEGDYIFLTIDDGSDNIQVKGWKEDAKTLEDSEVGTTILLIGRVRESNNQRYLSPEVIKKLDKPEWLILRKKELTEIYGDSNSITQPVKIESPIKESPQEPSPIVKPTIVEEVVKESSKENERQKILNMIKIDSSDEGVDKSKIINDSEFDEQKTEEIIQNLLQEGEIFEIKPGKVKLL
jgi:RecG-like helicase